MAVLGAAHPRIDVRGCQNDLPVSRDGVGSANNLRKGRVRGGLATSGG